MTIIEPIDTFFPEADSISKAMASNIPLMVSPAIPRPSGQAVIDWISLQHDTRACDIGGGTTAWWISVSRTECSSTTAVIEMFGFATIVVG